MSEPAVEVKNLTKVFSLGLKKDYVVAVDNLSFEVKAGEVYGLIGELARQEPADHEGDATQRQDQQ